LHQSTGAGMDIKKEFSYVLTDKRVKRFFQELQEGNSVFGGFESLSAFIHFMHTPSHLSIPTQNQCLLSIISQIQTSSDQEAGLSLLTYLLSPGLQKILYRNIFAGESAQVKFQSLWWHFYQSIIHYPISNRPQRVAQNLLFDTLRGFLAEQRQYPKLRNNASPDSDTSQEFSVDNISSSIKEIGALIEGSDSFGLSAMDRDLVISTRIYEEPMQEIAERWGLNCTTAYHRRKQAEQKLKERWKDEQ